MNRQPDRKFGCGSIAPPTERPVLAVGSIDRRNHILLSTPGDPWLIQGDET
jgi:hypothetical protein